MTAFRILDQVPVYLDLLGQPASGGTLRFFDNVTDTPKDVFGDPDLTVNNGSSVLIGTDGRTVVDVWGDGVYRVRLYAADNTLIAEAEDVEIPGGAGTSIPALSANKFLTNDGAVMSWADVLQVPDPTGSSSKILGTDGVNLLWQAPPTVETPTSTDSSFSFGGLLIQRGTGSAPASGTKVTSLAVAFGTAFAATPFVCVNHPNSLSPAGFLGSGQASGETINGFTAVFDVNVAETGASFNIVNPVPFSWLAIGKAPA